MAALALALLAGSSLASRAQMTNMAPAAPAPPANPQAAAGNKPGVPPVPVDYFQRYGKILSAGNEPSHPLKLAMPFPDVGQVKVPGNDELAMREKLERLTTMSDEDIRADLANWPAFKQMSLADEGAMLMRIQMFKDHRAKVAQDRAHALGLLTLKPDQMEKFTNEYWEKRLQMDRDLARQFGPVYKAAEDKMEEQLYREYSTPAKPIPAPPGKPGGAPVALADPKPGA
jgi:hypothetical protein